MACAKVPFSFRKWAAIQRLRLRDTALLRQ